MSDQNLNVSVSNDCIGAGLCVTLAPDLFKFSDGRAQRTGQPAEGEESISSILSAAEGCPAAAITAVRS
ncbi:ferredoxin [Rhodococcus sp. WS4]|nr:ferredoxin [Rhodococcus sp. WS4]